LPPTQAASQALVVNARDGSPPRRKEVGALAVGLGFDRPRGRVALVCLTLLFVAAGPAPASAHGQIDRVQQASEQAVFIKLKLVGSGYGTPAEQDAVHAIERKLKLALAPIKDAQLSGDEFGDGVCAIYVYGRDADAMLAAIKPVVDDWPALKGGTITRRYGPPKAREVVDKY